MSGPSVTVDEAKIEANARAIVGLCAEHGIETVGVCKVVCGMPAVAKAMIRGGVVGIGESRLENVQRLRAGGIVAPIALLRIPPLSAAADIVASVDASLNSEMSVLRALSRAAEERGVAHKVVLMVDLGDLREGFWPDDLMDAVRETMELPGIKFQGIGANLACYGGVIPTEKNMNELADWACRIEDGLGVRVETVSGGNSSALPLVAAGKMPGRINQLRIGEAILLGRETIRRQPWPGTAQDAFALTAEIIELKRKPSVPIGETGQDAFGGKPVFADKGEIMRAILNVGREDADVGGLVPRDANVTILGASSDHLIADVTACRPPLSLGDELTFDLSYAALLAVMTSAYVEKRLVADARTVRDARVLFAGKSRLFADASQWQDAARWGCDPEFADEPESAAWLDWLREGGRMVVAGKKARAAELCASTAAAGLPLGMIWIGPELDFPFALLGVGPEAVAEECRVSPEHLVFLGLRNANEEKAELVRRFRIETYTMEDVDVLGIRETVRRALRRAAAGSCGILVRFDPTVADRGRDGLTDRECHLAMETVAASDLLRVLDVSGREPVGERDVRRWRRFMLSALGKRILTVSSGTQQKRKL